MPHLDIAPSEMALPDGYVLPPRAGSPPSEWVAYRVRRPLAAMRAPVVHIPVKDAGPPCVAPLVKSASKRRIWKKDRAPESKIEAKNVRSPPVMEPLADGEHPKICRIIAVCAKHFGFSQSDLNSARRSKDLVLARHIAFHLAKRLTLRSLPEIGFYAGNRDHTTVYHGARRIAELVEADPAVRAKVEAVEREIMGGGG